MIKKVQLAQLLWKKGQRIEYLYDIGDHFRHKILLEEIEEQTETNKGVIELLDGQYACPPEDGHGNWKYSVQWCEIDKGLSNRRCKEAIEEFSRAANYRNSRTPFDPKAFDFKKTKVIFNEVLKTPPSNNDLSNMTCTNFLTGKKTGGENLGKEKTLTPKEECVVCGKTGDLKKCSRCRIMYYCNKEHQNQDWKRHKLECQKDISA